MIISVANQKGGVAKTTSTLNIAAGLQKKGVKVLLIDLDPQASLTYGVGLQAHTLEKTIYDLLVDEDKYTSEYIVPSPCGLDIIPANLNLSAADMTLAGYTAREYLLTDILKKIEGYDLILIDTPPALSLLTINAFTASNKVYIPVQPDFMSLQGIGLLMQTIKKIQHRPNPNLEIGGVIITRFNAQLNITKESVNFVKEQFGDLLFKSYIRENSKLKEAPSNAISIFEYDKYSNGAKDYNALCDEIVKRENL